MISVQRDWDLLCESCGMDARGAASGAGMPLGRDVGVFHREELERRTLMS